MPVLLVLLFAGREAVGMTVSVRNLIGSGSVVVPMSMADAIATIAAVHAELDFMGRFSGNGKGGVLSRRQPRSMLKNLFSFFLDLFILRPVSCSAMANRFSARSAT